MRSLIGSNVVFRVDPKLTQHRPPRLTLAKTLETLRERILSGELDANLIVEILNENRLLPHIIGDTGDLQAVSLGQLTNPSKIGDIIVSEECIKGTYELCLAFLSFVLTTVRSRNYMDNTKTMLASITYIVNDIFANHHIWSYKNVNDMHTIMCQCIQIFNEIIVLKSLDNKAIHDVCVISLSHNQAHKQLLNCIVSGKQKKKEEDIVTCTRQSLIIFDKLLSSSQLVINLVESQQPPSTLRYDSSTNSASTPLTNIEKALFDTTIRPGLLQHLFDYIYQKEDQTTACLAVDLIKKVAERFSMSLMACLGSEADRVCEFFIDCLGQKKADIKLEVAILDLLSTCVKHQPGLIELFLNFNSDKSDQTTSLQVVLNLLKECRDRNDDSHRLLNAHIMKFILTFWQKCHSAIEQFDKAQDFWNLVTHSLVRFLESGPTIDQDCYSQTMILEDKVNSFALMILAREVFNVSVGINERKIHPGLRDKFDHLAKQNFMSKYSQFVVKRYSTVLSNADKTEDYNRLLMSWRDFLASFSKYKPFEASEEVQRLVVEDILTCLSVELKLGLDLNKERAAAISETLLLIWTKWMTKSFAGDKVFNSIHELLYLVDASKEYLPFAFILNLQSTLNLYLMRNRDELTKYKRSFDLLVPALQLMQFSLKVMEQHINLQYRRTEFDYKPGIESRLCQTSIMTLRFIIDIAHPFVDLWISYIQTNVKTDALIQFLTILMHRRAGAEVCHSLIELLLCLASIRQTADYLNKSSLISQVNMIAVSAYERPYAHILQLASSANELSHHSQNRAQLQNHRTTETSKAPMSDTERIFLDGINSNLDWLPIYRHVIRLNISMILTLDNDYMSTAVEFLTMHCVRICELIELLRTKPRSVNMDEALQQVYLINMVLRHGCMWRKKNKQSYDAISDEIAKTAYSLATSALPPPVTGDSQQAQHTSLRPRDCLIYARCCYDFAKYTEAERVLFQTKFGDKDGFIKEAAQIYGEDLRLFAFHLAALICLKTNRQSDSLDFALQVFSEDPEYFDTLSAFAQHKG